MENEILTYYKELVNKAIIHLLFGHDVIGTIAVRCGVFVINSDRSSCAYTDGEGIYINAQYCCDQGVGLDELLFIIAHEVFHLLTLTVSRGDDKNRFVWNCATDYVINNTLHNDRFFNSRPKAIEFIEKCLYDSKYNNWSAERVYDDILLRMELKDGKIDWRVGGSPKVVMEDRDEIIEDNLELSIKIGDIAKGSSSKSQEMIRKFLGYLPQVTMDWKNVLNRYIKGFCTNKSTWKQPNKRFLAGAGVYLPSSHNTPKLKIAIGVDTSGSIDVRKLDEFIAHTFKILKSYQSFKVDLFCWSTVVHTDTAITLTEKNYKTFSAKDWIRSEGGTYLTSAFNYIKEMKDIPDVVLIFTDGEIWDDVEFKACPVLFAIHGKSQNPFNPPVGLTRTTTINLS